MTAHTSAAIPAAFALTFLAPPAGESDHECDDALEQGPPSRPAQYSSSARSFGVHAPAAVRWHPKARIAAGQMGISEDSVADAIDQPDDVQPDARDPKCTLFRRGKLTVVTGREGLVIAVRRR